MTDSTASMMPITSLSISGRTTLCLVIFYFDEVMLWILFSSVAMWGRCVKFWRLQMQAGRGKVILHCVEKWKQLPLDDVEVNTVASFSLFFLWLLIQANHSPYGYCVFLSLHFIWDIKHICSIPYWFFLRSHLTRWTLALFRLQANKICIFNQYLVPVLRNWCTLLSFTAKNLPSRCSQCQEEV